VEPLKLVAVGIAGSGHWITGTVAIVCAYALSVLVVERLFLIVKPKLLKLAWFAALWKWFVATRGTALGWLGFNRARTRMAGRPAAARSPATHR